MKTSLSIIAAFLLFRIAAVAQHQNVVIAQPVGYGLPTEAAVFISPQNPDLILAAAMPNFSYLSADGGQTWTQQTLSCPYGVNADPVVLMDNSDRLYYFHLPDVINRIICQKADQPGLSWNMISTPAYDGIHDVDKPWASYDPVNDAINLTWTYFDHWGSSNPADSSCIYYSRSADGGSTWTTPSRVSDKKGNATGSTFSTHGSYSTAGPGGEVYVAWFSPQGLMFDRSSDGGTTWLPQDIHVTPSHIYWQYSIPGISLGVTFPFIACDHSSGAYHGNIYICWADKRNGSNDADVFLARSSDGGLTWSNPVRVNDDPAGKYQFFPALTVDPVTGKIWIVFFDRRNYTDTNTDVYMAMSADGGLTFTNFKVSETPFIPYSTVFFGHYIGVSAYNDLVFPVWNRMDDGQSTLMGAIVNTEVVGVPEQGIPPLASVLNWPNPFTESLFISFRLKKAEKVSIRLFDLRGREVASPVKDHEYSSGKHVYRINASGLGLTPGAYIVKISAGQTFFTSKIIMVESQPG